MGWGVFPEKKPPLSGWSPGGLEVPGAQEEGRLAPARPRAPLLSCRPGQGPSQKPSCSLSRVTLCCGLSSWYSTDCRHCPVPHSGPSCPPRPHLSPLPHAGPSLPYPLSDSAPVSGSSFFLEKVHLVFLGHPSPLSKDSSHLSFLPTLMSPPTLDPLPGWSSFPVIFLSLVVPPRSRTSLHSPFSIPCLVPSHCLEEEGSSTPGASLGFLGCQHPDLGLVSLLSGMPSSAGPKTPKATRFSVLSPPPPGPTNHIPLLETLSSFSASLLGFFFLLPSTQTSFSPIPPNVRAS